MPGFWLNALNEWMNECLLFNLSMDSECGRWFIEVYWRDTWYTPCLHYVSAMCANWQTHQIRPDFELLAERRTTRNVRCSCTLLTKKNILSYANSLMIQPLIWILLTFWQLCCLLRNDCLLGLLQQTVINHAVWNLIWSLLQRHSMERKPRQFMALITF